MLDAETLFSVTNALTSIGWLCLLASPLLPRLADVAAGVVIPLMLSVIYASLIMAFWTRAEGGFDTLPNVMLLFTDEEVALAGWTHFLAFDLFIGAWIVRTARREGVAFLLVAPCLVFTFLLGPIGFLLFSALRAARALRPNRVAAARA